MSKRKLGQIFTQTEDDDGRLGEVFHGAKGESFPSVVVIDGYDEFRAAVQAGTLDLSRVEARYGRGAYEATAFLPLPALSDGSDQKRAFRMQDNLLLPPGER